MPIYLEKFLKSKNANRQGLVEIGFLLHCWWELPSKDEAEIAHDLAIPLVCL